MTNVSWLKDLVEVMKYAKPALETLGYVSDNKYVKAAAGVAGGIGTAASGALKIGTANAANAATPSPKPAAPKGDPGGIPKQIGPAPGAQPQPKTPAPIKGGHPDHPWTGHLQKAQQAATQKAELLKVKPGGYTKESGLQESYLKGLEQSGAKLDNKGQIVKQSGQAYKKVGWDREAQLKAMDPMRRQRMLAIDRANIGAKDVKPPGETVMKTKVTQTSREEDLSKRYSPSEEYLKTDEGKDSSNWDPKGLGTNSGKPKPKPSGITDEEMRKKYYKHKNGNWYEKGYDPGKTPLW